VLGQGLWVRIHIHAQQLARGMSGVLFPLFPGPRLDFVELPISVAHVLRPSNVILNNAQLFLAELVLKMCLCEYVTILFRSWFLCLRYI
jgi:hypothetical protein